MLPDTVYLEGITMAGDQVRAVMIRIDERVYFSTLPGGSGTFSVLDDGSGLADTGGLLDGQIEPATTMYATSVDGTIWRAASWRFVDSFTRAAECVSLGIMLGLTLGLLVRWWQAFHRPIDRMIGSP